MTLDMGIQHGPCVRAYPGIMATVTMSIPEFLQFEILAFKRKWDYRVKKNSVEVTAEEALLQELGYQE